MKAHRILPLLAGLTIAAAASAQSTETFDVVFASAGSPLDANGTATIALPQFDTNLGTLDSVSLTLNSTLIGYAKVLDPFAGTGTFTNAWADFSSSGNYITLSGPAGLTETAHPFITGFSGTVPGNSSVLSPGISSSFGTAASDSNLSLYEAAGGGTLNENISFSAFGTYSGTQVGGNQVFFGSEATASGDLSVEYTFTAIPEPSTYAAILGAAVLGFAFIRRRRAA
jgi:hypothetical protein